MTEKQLEEGWTVEKVRALEDQLTETEQREVVAYLKANGWHGCYGLPLWVCGQAFAAKLALRRLAPPTPHREPQE